MYWLTFASLFSAPTPVGFYPWFSEDDVPAFVQSNNAQYSLLLRTVVDPSGTLHGCEIETSKPDHALDAFTCSLVLKRARLKPARWIDGSPAVGVHRSTVIWQASPRPTSPSYDLMLLTDRLPQGVRSPAYVRVIFAADERGVPVSCDGAEKSNKPTLVELACAELTRRFVAIPPKDVNGGPVRSVQNGTVKVVKRSP